MFPEPSTAEHACLKYRTCGNGRRAQIREIQRVQLGLLCLDLCSHVGHTGSQVLTSACEVSKFLFAQDFADSCTALMHSPQKNSFKSLRCHRFSNSNTATAVGMAAGIVSSAATAITIVVTITTSVNGFNICGLNAGPMITAVATFIANQVFQKLPHAIVTGSCI